MDNERPSEFRSWRHRLEEPGALPGAGLTDKEAAWDKLYQRLGETPRRKTLPWLWIAAACLLLALVPAAFFLREKKVIPHPNTLEIAVQPGTHGAQAHPAGQSQPRTPNPMPETQNNLPAPAMATATPLHPARGERPGHIAKNTTPSVAATVLSLAATGRQSPARAPVALQSPVPGTMDHPDLLKETHPDPSKPLIVAQTPPKKEPRVIHINELEPPQLAPSTAGPRLKPGRLHIGLIPAQDVLRPATTFETRQTDYPIILFKHTIPNP